jgi:hypothetical protein
VLTTSPQTTPPAQARVPRVQMMALGKRDESCDLRSDNGPLSRSRQAVEPQCMVCTMDLVASEQCDGWQPASRRCTCASRAPGSRSQAATGRRMRAGWCGGNAWPSGKSPPISSNRMTPLHSRLHPCSGWKAMVWAASRSERSAGGHGGRCGHMASLWDQELRTYVDCGPLLATSRAVLVTAPAKTVGVGRWPAASPLVQLMACTTSGSSRRLRARRYVGP